MARLSDRWLLRGGIAALDLSPAEALVLLAVVGRANREGIAFPSQYTIAAELGVARSTVQSALIRLVGAGALEVHEPGRQGRSTRYRIGNQPARSQGQLRAVN